MKIKISLDITDDRSERSARSSIRVGPPTDAIRQLLIVGYRGKRRGVGLSSILEKLCSSGGCVPECRTAAATSAAIMAAIALTRASQ